MGYYKNLQTGEIKYSNSNLASMLYDENGNSMVNPTYVAATYGDYAKYTNPGLANTQYQYLVDPNLKGGHAGQETLQNLINSRSNYLEQSSKPYEQALYGMMSYGNPALQNQYINQAIPKVMNSFTQAEGMTNRMAGAGGMAFDPTESKLSDRLNALKQSETVAATAKTIRNRLKERDLMTALGMSSTAGGVAKEATNG